MVFRGVIGVGYVDEDPPLGVVSSLWVESEAWLCRGTLSGSTCFSWVDPYRDVNRKSITVNSNS